MTKKTFLPGFMCLMLFHSSLGGLTIPVSEYAAIAPEHPAPPPCTLPAPANFHLTAVGSYFISTAWDAVSGASAYKVDVYTSTGGQVWVGGTTVSGTTATVNVPFGGPYDVSVAAVCSDGTPSSNTSWITDVEIIIIEIVADFPPPNCTSGPTTYTGSVDVYVDWETGVEYQYDVVKSQRKSRYGVEIIASDYVVTGKVSTSNYSPSWNSIPKASTETGLSQSPPLSNIKQLFINDTGESGEYTVYTITYKKSAGDQLWLHFSNQNNNYSLLFYDCTTSARGKREGAVVDRSGEQDISGGDLDFVAVQNPFSDQLKLFITGAAETMVSCTLTDLDGRVALHQPSVTGGQMILHTGNLAPGFYLLRVNTARENRTYKVFKTR